MFVWQNDNKQQNLVKCPPSLYGRLIQKTRTGASFIPGWLFYFVSCLYDDGLFHITVICLKVHFISIKHVCDSKLQTLRMRYRPIQFTCKPISKRNRWSFRVYMMLLQNFVPEWISSSGTITGVNLRRGDSRRHDILWWYPEPWEGTGVSLRRRKSRPRCHVNTPLHADHWGTFLCPL